MRFAINPITNEFDIVGLGSGAPDDTLTGNSGGAVSPDSSFNINVLGDNTSGINTVGNGSPNTLTIFGLASSTTQIGTSRYATNAEATGQSLASVSLTPANITSLFSTNPLPSSQGGTGLSSPTAHSLIVANGSSAFTVLGSATNGQIPIGFTGADPVLGTLTQGNGITITNGAGTITIAANIGTGAAGTVLQGQGIGVTPAFSTATYPATATGTGTLLRADGTNWSATSATYPNTVTSQSILLGTSANVVGALAVSAVPGSPVGTDGTNAVYLNPRTYLSFFDDFIGASVNNYYAYGASSTGTGSATDFNGNSAQSHVTSANPGVLSLVAGSTTTSRATVRMNASGTGQNGWHIPGGGAFSTTFYVQLSAVSDINGTYTAWIGLANLTDGSAPSNGYWFSYTDSANSGNWIINCTVNGSNTPANTSTGIGAGAYHRLRIDGNAAGTAIHFYVDDVEVANSPISSNITTNGVAPVFQILKSAGAQSRAIYVDYWSYYQQLTTTR